MGWDDCNISNYCGDNMGKGIKDSEILYILDDPTSTECRMLNELLTMRKKDIDFRGKGRTFGLDTILAWSLAVDTSYTTQNHSTDQIKTKIIVASAYIREVVGQSPNGFGEPEVKDALKCLKLAYKKVGDYTNGVPGVDALLEQYAPQFMEK